MILEANILRNILVFRVHQSKKTRKYRKVTDTNAPYQYPSNATLKIYIVYATIAFYLKHQQEVEAYLQQRQQQAQAIRTMNQSRFDSQGWRDRLLTRKAEQEKC